MKHLLGFSGGIDSQATALFLRRKFPASEIILMNSDAGKNEHPLTTEHLNWYSENVFPIVFINATVADMGNRAKAGIERRGLKPTDPLTFDLLAELKHCFPSRRKQFCTEHLKLMPQRRWIGENVELLKGGYDRYTGVRADESTDRGKLPETEWDDFFDCELHRPLISWTKKQCFDFVQDAGEKINSLYTLGFGRVGCAPCVNSNKEDIRQWAARFPEMIDKVRDWETKVGKTFFHGNPPRFVDEVVAWSRTVHGGKQIALPFVEAEADAGTCSSKYGLCE